MGVFVLRIYVRMYVYEYTQYTFTNFIRYPYNKYYFLSFK